MRTRTVLDVNIFASALMKAEGPLGQALRLCVSGGKYELVLSQAILEELQRVLFYPKIRSRIARSDKELFAWIDALSLISHFVVPRHAYAPLVQEDPDDDRYLIAALESRAKYLVSGDKHLLKIGSLEDIRILTASDFLRES